MRFTGIGGIPSATTKAGNDVRKGVSILFLSARREGKDRMVGVRNGSTGREGHQLTSEPVIRKSGV